MDEAAREMILNELQQGSSATAACGLAGVHPGTYAEWIRKGKLDVTCETIYGEFYVAVMKAKAMHEKAVASKVAAAGHWRAQAFILENLYPETWSPKQRVELSGVGGGPITTRDLDNLTNDQLMRLMQGESLEEVLKDGNSN